MKAMRLWVPMMAAFAVTALPSAANAIVITTTSATWSAAVGGSNIVYNGANGAFTDVRWGQDLGTGQSGLGFDPANPPSADFAPDTAFLLGTLRHYNNPIAGGTAATSVDLALATTVAGGNPAAQAFAFRFLIDETPNVEPCAYASSTPCADQITFQNLDLTSAFDLGGTPYTIELLGFAGSVGGTIVSSFLSQEGGTNNAYLYGRFVSPTSVPEPLTLSLFSLGLLVTGVATRRRRR